MRSFVDRPGRSRAMLSLGQRKTLVVHTGGIGDLLLACPALSQVAVRESIDMLGLPERLQIAVAAGIADRLFSMEAVEFASLFSRPSEVFREFIGSYGRVIVWMRDLDGAIVGGIRSCGVESACAFPGLPPEDWKWHASEYYCRMLGVSLSEPVRLSFPGTEFAEGPGGSAPCVVIHPGSGGPKKNWPMEGFRAVAGQLERRGCRVVWSLGPAEEEFVLPRGSCVLGRRELVALGAELARFGVYLGNDSGITHLAAACGCDVVAVFGPTDPGVWAPRGETVRVVCGDPWPEVSDVLEAIEPLIN